MYYHSALAHYKLKDEQKASEFLDKSVAAITDKYAFVINPPYDSSEPSGPSNGLRATSVVSPLLLTIFLLAVRSRAHVASADENSQRVLTGLADIVIPVYSLKAKLAADRHDW